MGKKKIYIVPQADFVALLAESVLLQGSGITTEIDPPGVGWGTKEATFTQSDEDEEEQKESFWE